MTFPSDEDREWHGKDSLQLRVKVGKGNTLKDDVLVVSRLRVSSTRSRRSRVRWWTPHRGLGETGGLEERLQKKRKKGKTV